MSFADSISQSLKKYFDFSGRASRSEFWFFLLFVAICDAVAGVLGRQARGRRGRPDLLRGAVPGPGL